ncbi:MAG: DUF748 domain-containing protein [Sedimenticola sp.]|nr:DUF748 domain-containing protein [Sedimenticola sp.]
MSSRSMPEAATPAKPRYSGLKTIATLIVILSVATISLLPQAIGYGLKKWITAQGGEKIAVSNVDFNPFTAELRIENLTIARNSKEQLTLPTLDLQLDWLPLWKKQIVITGLQLSDVGLQLHHNEEGKQLIVGGMKFDLTPTEAQQDGTPWKLRVDQIKLTNSTLIYNGPLLTSSATLNQLTLSGLDTANTEKTVKLLFDGVIDNASVSLNGEATPFSASPTFNGEISIKDLSMAAYSALLRPEIKQLKGNLNTSGTISLKQPSNKRVETAFNGSFRLNDFLADTSSQQLTGNELMWNGKLQTSLNNYALDGKLHTKNITYQDEQKLTYRHSQADWSGKLLVDLKPEQKAIKGNGRLTLKQPDLQNTGSHIKAEQAELTATQATLTLANDEREATVTAKLKLDGTTVSSSENELLSEAVTWDGTTELKQTAAGTLISADGRLDGEAFKVTENKLNLAIGYSTVKWLGLIGIEQTAGQVTVKPTGELLVEGLKADDLANNLGLFDIHSIQLEQINHSEAGIISAAQILASKITIGKSLTKSDHLPQLDIAAISLNLPSFSPDTGLSIDKIEATDLKQRLTRAADKSWNYDQLTRAIKRISTSENEPANPLGEPLPIQIGQITLLGDNEIAFLDQTTEPAFQTRLKPSTLTVTDISNHTPKKLAQFDLKGLIGESSTIDFTGSIKPFAAKTTFDLKGRIEGLELPRLSPYTAPLMGYKLQSGKANSDIQLSARAGKLEGSSDLIINQLEVEPLGTEKMAALQTQLSIPLETALGMLKDKNNQIKLNLPISGDIENITVDPSDAINQAIGRAMKKGAKTYLATALFPFGTLLTLVELAGDAAAKVQLDPIPFKPGSNLIQSEQDPYLEKVAQLLNDRPEIHIRLCGVTVDADRLALIEQEEQQRQARTQEKKDSEKGKKGEVAAPLPPVSIIDEQLNRLATERAVAIERHLSEKHKIKGDRLISCLPRIETDKQKSQPRADLLI